MKGFEKTSSLISEAVVTGKGGEKEEREGGREEGRPQQYSKVK